MKENKPQIINTNSFEKGQGSLGVVIIVFMWIIVCGCLWSVFINPEIRKNEESRLKELSEKIYIQVDQPKNNSSTRQIEIPFTVTNKDNKRHTVTFLISFYGLWGNKSGSWSYETQETITILAHDSFSGIASVRDAKYSNGDGDYDRLSRMGEFAINDLYWEILYIK